ncbi:helix-turn-helix transcriptional regulator [Streptomyces poriferorum]|uniref:helix-turn-helix transcriptional regulator n=1 Tax=Streptomyces poriferorum TaxID=2798799 RepID=UPI0027E00E4D|nr:helix-turn-helix domain-containing protein [Streptomyces poriferorum]
MSVTTTPTPHITRTHKTTGQEPFATGSRMTTRSTWCVIEKHSIGTAPDTRRVASEGNVAANRRLAKPAYLQTIVVHRLPRAPLRISPPEGTQRLWRTQNPPTLHLRAASPVADRFPLYLSGALHTPGDPTPLPIKPIAAYTDRQTHTKNEKDAQFIRDDSRSSLLANAWYSTRELAACLRVDTSTLRRWRTARPPQGPPFVSVSERVVMYSAVDVEEWLRRRRTIPRRDA